MQVATPCARTARPHVVPCGSTSTTTTCVLNSAEGRAWPANVRRDRRVALNVVNLENPYEYVSIEGTLVEDTHEGADEHIDALAKKYLDATSTRSARRASSG